MPASIRRLGPSDWRLLRDARLRALGDAPYAFESTAQETSTRPDGWWQWSASSWAWFVATEGAETVGMVAGLRAAGDDPHTRSVISLWVAPTHRGAGVAGELMTALSAWASADAAGALALRVAEGNERARRFFERLGFRPAGEGGELRLSLSGARLRFGPSPAGELHVGHARTAVLTWILARQLGGSYFVRFENTDRDKEVPGARAAIVADLAWLGLQGDEAAHDQADLTDAHRSALDRLRSHGDAYVDDGAVRFRVPPAGTVAWDDLARGPVSVAGADLRDPVLVRSNGTPTFYLASTVDDAAEGISHLVRVESLLRSTAIQIQIWRSLGKEPPRMAHVPMMAGVRIGGTELTIRALRERGLRPLPLLAYLAMPATASWKPPPADLDAIVERVDIGRLARRPRGFDLRALDGMNRRYVAAAATA